MSNPTTTVSFSINQAVNVIVSGAPVSIELLRAVLTAAEVPTEVAVFCNRNLASACIRLLQETSEHCSILDDEFCVLCLRIIVTCIHVATLVVLEAICGFIDEAISCDDHSLTIARFAVAALSDRIRDDSEPLLDPVINVAKSVTLIKLLSGARNRFLFNRCAHSKLWGGWSFLLLPTWTHLIFGDMSTEATIASMVGDLACRFSAGEFIYNDEQAIVEFMAETCGTRHRKITGTTRGYYLGQTDERDSELVITAVATRMFAGSLSLKLAFDLCLWATYCSDNSQPSLMVLLLQASISRLWRTLDPAEDNQPLTYERLREVVQFPGVLLLYTMMRRSTASVPEVMPMHTAAIPLLNGVLDLNILGLLARTLMFPLPRNYGTLDPIQQGSLEIIFNDQLKAIDEFGNFLSRFDSLDIKALQDSHTDWLRAAQHFEEHCHMYNGDRFTRTYISKCRAVWTKLGSSLVSNCLDGCSVPCSYPRCPHPTALGGVPFACRGCREATYCSYRCQNLHWSCALSEGSHADACSSSLATNLS